ncbi:hypothetical protein GC101_35360 [Paenibacillus sp. LMG 31459]|uniref:PLD phosphodiesterase domain-containing protein n=1 Tax=Paenibacillus phytohabitans TaxID=2654978 RepID=A0ABX1YSQ9_9BACL|nr:hypothetical protein [Paenibacillus phytohabitans]NOU84130.1 hypothetical protein [Paenibacillus phytohabitans]
MITRLSFKEGVFISTKGEFGYQDVLDDFQYAKQIRIATFNISFSEKDDPLFEGLQKLNEDVDIKFVSNIPARMSFYASSPKGKSFKERASANINAYLKKLNPADFDAVILPYFNFNNHSKIIGTENIIYIGSENYSVESSQNYESGVLVSDKEFIVKLYELFFEKLIDESVPYFNDDYDQLRLFTMSILTRMLNHFESYKDKFFRVNREGIFYFIEDETSFTEDDIYVLLHDLNELNSIQGLVENIESDDDKTTNILSCMVDICGSMHADSFIELIEYDTNFYNYVIFNRADETIDIFDKEYSGIADEEWLEHYLEIAADEANDKFEEICNEVSADVYAVKDHFDDIIDKLKELVIKIRDLSEDSVNPAIDNTSR